MTELPSDTPVTAPLPERSPAGGTTVPGEGLPGMPPGGDGASVPGAPNQA